MLLQAGFWRGFTSHKLVCVCLVFLVFGFKPVVHPQFVSFSCVVLFVIVNASGIKSLTVTALAFAFWKKAVAVSVCRLL